MSLKYAIAQLNYRIGHIDYNQKIIEESVSSAIEKGADVIVFSELAICGYPPRDFLEFEDFVEDCLRAIEEIARLSTEITIIIGGPDFNPSDGKRLYNTAFVLSDGKIASRTYKTLLPTYDIFDEHRYFEVNDIFKIVNVQGQNIALTICEDIWNVPFEAEEAEHLPYDYAPLDFLKEQQPDLVINLSASPYNHHQPEKRIAVLHANWKLHQLPMIYVNTVGCQTDILFDGGSLVMNNAGEIVHISSRFEEVVDIIDGNRLFEEKAAANTSIESKYALLESALICGVRDYFEKLNFKQATLGLSGGIDSALVCYLAAKALGPENVHPVLLPSQYSSQHSIDDSVALCQNLGITYKEISIQETFESFLHTLKPHFDGKKEDVTEENLQARSRAVILMALSNKHGYILLNTSNKSEAAVGYGTLYGDMCGGLAVIGDIYKTEVFELCRYINRNEEVIPDHILTKPPSAELRPNQKDSDSLPDYDILDSVLYQYIEQRNTPQEIIESGFDAALVKRVVKMVNNNEWKRFQMPPVIRVSSKAFGMGRRMPIVARHLS